MPYVSVNPEKELLQAKLKELAEEISEDLSALEARRYHGPLWAKPLARWSSG